MKRVIRSRKNEARTRLSERMKYIWGEVERAVGSFVDVAFLQEMWFV